MSSYLVTGAAGFIGSHLCAELQEQGARVRGIDAFTDYYARNLKEENLACARDGGQLEFVEDDLASADLDSVLDGVDGVFHLAAQPGVRASWGREFEIYLRDNLLVTQRIFQACASRGIRVVYASSSSIYGDAETYPTTEDVVPRPISPYGITKLGCEHLARSFGRAAGVDAVGLRYFTVFGPRQRPDMAFTRLARAAVLGETFSLLGDGRQSRDFTFVMDAVSATIGAMRHGRAGVNYNVGGGAETSLREVIELLEDLSGHQITIRWQERVAGDVFRTASDTTAIRRDVGWTPTTSIRAGLAAQLHWIEATSRRDGDDVAVSGATPVHQR
ncbi:MAG: NAD-dependent epimerase/dehydratase family protein [Solirubrobacterales bacterium]|nr:NAD-dependent epimerase/dehydratase family protein [Solirubrobacterales bacterium]